jgi:hypothetical protein
MLASQLSPLAATAIFIYIVEEAEADIPDYYAFFAAAFD